MNIYQMADAAGLNSVQMHTLHLLRSKNYRAYCELVHGATNFIDDLDFIDKYITDGDTTNLVDKVLEELKYSRMSDIPPGCVEAILNQVCPQYVSFAKVTGVSYQDHLYLDYSFIFKIWDRQGNFAPWQFLKEGEYTNVTRVSTELFTYPHITRRILDHYTTIGFNNDFVLKNGEVVTPNQLIGKTDIIVGSVLPIATIITIAGLYFGHQGLVSLGTTPVLILWLLSALV